jgi:4-hydroxy 2-oxovalerate aldolase
MEWVGKRYYSFNSIIRALNNQSDGKMDNTKLPELDFVKEKQYGSALIIGGGPSAVLHAKAIKSFLRLHPDALVIHASSKNALSFTKVPNDQYFCLVGNEGHRLEDVFRGENIMGKCILPPYPREMGTYIPKVLENRSFELSEISFTPKYKDSHTALALQSLLALGVETAYVTGYDGYGGKQISQKEQELYLENQFLFGLIKESHNVLLKSITPSTYTELVEDSVYSKI